MAISFFPFHFVWQSWLESDLYLKYEDVVKKIRGIVNSGHINLVETLAERIAASILMDKRIDIVKVCVEKLDIISDAASVGIEIERKRRT